MQHFEGLGPRHSQAVQEPQGRGQCDTSSLFPRKYFRILDWMTMAFTLSAWNCCWRVLSREVTKEAKLCKAPRAAFGSPTITQSRISYGCVLPIWQEALFLLCLLGSLPLPHHVHRAPSLQLCFQTLPLPSRLLNLLTQASPFLHTPVEPTGMGLLSPY